MDRRHFITGSLGVLAVAALPTHPAWRERQLKPLEHWTELEPGEYCYVHQYFDCRNDFGTTLAFRKHDGTLFRQAARTRDIRLITNWSEAIAIDQHKELLRFWALKHGMVLPT